MGLSLSYLCSAYDIYHISIDWQRYLGCCGEGVQTSSVGGSHTQGFCVFRVHRRNIFYIYFF